MKWVVGIGVALVAYALLQPVANRQLGWKLPSLAAMAEQANDHMPAPNQGAGPSTRNQEIGADSAAQERRDGQSQQPNQDALPGPASNSTDDSSPGAPRNSPDEDSRSQQASPRGPPGSLPIGDLKQIAPEDFLSPAGLRYTRGSEEGHRLLHLAKHLDDDPTRPGSHGVFDGDLPQVLRWLDEAYERVEQGAKGTTKRQERDRVVVEVQFDKRVGYVGGSSGARRGKPESKKIRLVLEGNRVITAFPF